MPEKCQFCNEVAVILETLEDGKEELICVECGSFATGAVSREIDLDSDLDDEAGQLSQTTNAEFASTSTACECCGISMNDVNKEKICSVCLSETQSEGNQTVEINNETNGGDEHNLTTGKTPGHHIKCLSCNSSNLSQESINGDERTICLDCGCVNSDVVLTNDAFCSLTRTDSNHLITLPRYSYQKRRNAGLKAGLEKIKYLCSKYCFPLDLKREADEMFKKLFNHPKVLHMTINMKQSIGAVCVFIICRQRDFPISLTLFKDDVYTFRSFLRANRHVLKILNIQLPHMSVTNQMVTFLCDIGFSKDIISKVKDILFLFRKAWLTQGRARQSLITIATYYAYLGSDSCNKYINLRKFCNQFKIPDPSQNLAKECKVLLLKLAQSLPWVEEGKVQIKNLHFYISNIISYQESLFHMIFVPEDGENIRDQAEASHKSSIRPHQSEIKEILMPSAAKRKKTMCDQPIEDVITLPHGINLDAPELQENEFADEINSYILSSDEETTIREHKKSIWET